MRKLSLSDLDVSCSRKIYLWMEALFKHVVFLFSRFMIVSLMHCAVLEEDM